MRFKSIKTRMLTLILTVIVICLGILVFISYNNSKYIINATIDSNIDAELRASLNKIDNLLDSVSLSSANVASLVENTYKTSALDQYEKMLEPIINSSELILGSGIWFEPYVYDKEKMYVGPYTYKDNGEIKTTYEYSNSDYDYFSYDWYTNAKNSNGETVFSTLYYDETLDTIMSSCSTPMYDESGKFMGVITVDMDLSSITGVVNSVNFSPESKILLLNEDGQ